MRIIIAGSRDIPESVALAIIRRALNPAMCGTVLSGYALGVDRAGEKWAYLNCKRVARYPADWSLGVSAGMARNSIMVANADALLALWDGVSKGTAHVVREATDAGLWVRVIRIGPPGLLGWANVLANVMGKLPEGFTWTRPTLTQEEFDRQYQNTPGISACPRCNGSGYERGSREACRECKGTGQGIT